MAKLVNPLKSLWLAALAALALAAPVAADQITVFAASSLKTALDQIAEGWQAQTGTQVVLAYDGSARLAGQILQGAPADIFLSAAPEWMAAAAPALQAGTVRGIAGNDLVLIAHGARPPQDISPKTDMAALLAGGRLAVGQAGSVPVGTYARQALQALGLWQGLAGKLAETDSARAVLDLVARGEAPAGVVFGSDLVAGQAAGMEISLIGRFPAGSHDPVRYEGALVAGSGPRAAAFLDHLGTPPAVAALARAGFKAAPP